MLARASTASLLFVLTGCNIVHILAENIESLGCPPGYGTSTQEPGCLPCGVSRYKETYGNEPCLQCPPNQAAWPLQTYPEVRKYELAGNFSIFRIPNQLESNCACNAGFYREDDGSCTECASGTVSYWYDSAECEASCPDGMEPFRWNPKTCVCQTDLEPAQDKSSCVLKTVTCTGLRKWNGAECVCDESATWNGTSCTCARGLRPKSLLVDHLQENGPECEPCDLGRNYKSEEGIQACSRCTFQWPVSDEDNLEVQRKYPGMFIQAACSTVRDTVLQACSLCPPGEAVATSCTWDTNVTCAPCSPGS